MTAAGSSIMENKCANCSANLEFEPDENIENEQNELILKRYYSLDVKSRFKSGGAKPLSSHSQNTSRVKSSSAVEEISIRRALSLIFDLEVESPSDPTDPSSPPPPALPICFVCHLILNDLYRAYIEFSELRQNNSYLGRELLKPKKNLNCGRQERDHHHENVRLKTGAKRPRISSGSISENSSFRERGDKEPIFQNSQPEENESSGLGIGIGISVGADVTEGADEPVRVKFEVFHDEAGTGAEEAQNDSYEYENAESMDMGQTLSSYKSEPDEEELQDRYSVEDETGAGGMPFVNIASSTSYSRPHHSRAQVDPGSSSSSFSMVSPYVEEDDADNFAGEDTGQDPLSLQTSSFSGTRSRYFRGTDSVNYEMILPNSGLGQNISQLTGSLISSPTAPRSRRRGPSQGQPRDQGVPVQLNAVAGGSAKHVSEKKKIGLSIRKECTTKGIIADYQENPFSCDNCASRFRSNDRLVTHKYRCDFKYGVPGSDEAPPADLDGTTNVKKTKPSDVPDDAPPIGEKIVYTVSRRGQPMAAWQGHTFYFDRQSSDPNPRKIWRCSKQTKKLKCFKRIHTRGEHVVKELYEHNHSASEEEIHRRDFISDFKKSAATMLNEPASAIVAEKLSNISESFKSALPTVRAMKRTVSYMRSREKVNLPNSTWTGHPTVLPETETGSTSSTLSITNVCTVTSAGANNSEFSD